MKKFLIASFWLLTLGSVTAFAQYESGVLFPEIRFLDIGAFMRGSGDPYFSSREFVDAQGRRSVETTVSTFNQDLYYGISNSTEVSLLQEFLLSRGHYSGPITGNFFLLTLEGVRRFQRAEGLRDTGYFGVETRSIANLRIRQTVGDPCRNVRCSGPQQGEPSRPSGSLRIATSSNLEGVTGQFFNAVFTVSGGSGDYMISFDNPIPGLSFSRSCFGSSCNPMQLSLSGVPQNAENYQIRITVSDSKTGNSFTQTYTVRIHTGQSSQGTFSLVADRLTGRAPLTVNFMATLRDMPSCGHTFTWDFGDGAVQTVNESCGGGQVFYPTTRTLAVTHTYQREGSYTTRFSTGSGAALVPISVSR